MRGDSFAAFLALCLLASVAAQQTTPPPDFGPLLFHSLNNGASYVARSQGLTVELTRSGYRVQVGSDADLLVAVGDASPLGRQLTPEGRHAAAHANYYLGDDPAAWKTQLPLYERVRVTGVHPGVDLVAYTSATGRFEFDFHVAAGADPAPIVMRFNASAARLLLSDNGDLHVAAPSSSSPLFVMPRPVIYQTAGASSRLVDGGYLVDSAAGTVRFTLGHYDAALPLVIDPILDASFSVDIMNTSSYSSVAVDAAGNFAAAGYNADSAGNRDAFVAIYYSSGTLYGWSSIGGVGNDEATAVAFRADGNLFIAGSTSSSNFPATSDAFDKTLNGTSDAFVLVLDLSLHIQYCSYLGGSGSELLMAGAVNRSNGDMTVVGATQSHNFPVTAGAFQTAKIGEGLGGFVVQIAAADYSFRYATYLCGTSAASIPRGLALDAAGLAVVVGGTSAPDFPASPASFGGSDAYVTKFNSTGYPLFSVRFGGNATDSALAVAVDTHGNVVVAGQSNSATLPNATNAPAGAIDGFLLKLSGSTGAQLFASFLGGSNNDLAAGIAADSADNYIVVGRTNSSDFPTLYPLQPYAGGLDAFATRFNSAGQIVSSTCFGGPSDDQASSVGVDPAGNVLVAGQSNSDSFTGLPLFQPGETLRGFITRMFDCPLNCSWPNGNCVGPNLCNCNPTWLPPDCSSTTTPTTTTSTTTTTTTPTPTTTTTPTPTTTTTPTPTTTTTPTPTTTTTPTPTTTTTTRTRTTSSSAVANATTTTTTITTTAGVTTTTTTALEGCFTRVDCQLVEIQTPLGSDGTLLTVQLPANSTDTDVTVDSVHGRVALQLGWGEIVEKTTSGRVVKGVDPNDGSWRRVVFSNETHLAVDYDSGLLTQSPWTDQPIRVHLIFEVRFFLVGSGKTSSKHQQSVGSQSRDQQNVTVNVGSFELKYSIEIAGDWKFASSSNTLHVDFSVTAPVRSHRKCGVDEQWKALPRSADALSYRVYLANRTAATLSYLTYCTGDERRRPARVGDPDVAADRQGWTTTVVFPPFNSSLFYDPSFALLLGYGDQLCNPLLSWILPASFIAAAAAIIVLVWLLTWFEPVSRFLLGERGQQIKNIRREIKQDAKAEASAQPPPAPTIDPSVSSDGYAMKIITNEEDL